MDEHPRRRRGSRGPRPSGRWHSWLGVAGGAGRIPIQNRVVRAERVGAQEPLVRYRLPNSFVNERSSLTLARSVVCLHLMAASNILWRTASFFS